MPKTALTLIVLLLFFSCTKDVGKRPDEHTIEQKDDIVYTDFEPDIVLNSVKTTSVLYAGGPLVNFPTDTNCSVSIKVMPEDKFSFVFTAANYYKAISFHQEANYNSYLILSTTNKFDSLSKTGNYACPNFLNYQQNIGEGSSYSRFGSVWLCQNDHDNKPFYCNKFSGDTYVSFKRTEGKKVFYGWIHVERIGANGVKIKEIAINKGSNRQILAGQKQ